MITQSFVSYLILAGMFMIFLFRGLYSFIDKLWINHKPRKEGILVKLTLLWRNSSIIVLSGVAVTILYSTFITNLFNIGSVSAPALAAIGILFAVLNSVYRIATYGHIYRGSECEIDDETITKRKKTFQRSYFSFILSLLIFAYIGIGIAILSDAFRPRPIVEITSLGIAFSYTLRILAATLLLSITSEILLWIGPFKVPNALIDDMD